MSASEDTHTPLVASPVPETASPPPAAASAQGAHRSRAESPKGQGLEPGVQKKRIVCCCDGTWQDGIMDMKKWENSNILKLSRMIDYEDRRASPTVPQIVFYQTGVGTGQNWYSRYFVGATGSDVAQKVQDAYAFIAHNYQPGDNIYLFGFSRGAYTARMIAALIGAIGVLDKKDMDSFAKIFLAYTERTKTKDPKELEKYNDILEPFEDPKSVGRRRSDIDRDTFTVQCVGVFDTVGSLGLPEEITFHRNCESLLGFPDRLLGSHVQYAFHAMAVNENRSDFDVAKFEQTEEGKAKGQVLRQVWFAGSHTDVGGGWQSHDLADIALAWMASQIEPLLSLDLDFLHRIPHPVAPWGEQIPHDPRTGIFALSKVHNRGMPASTSFPTHEAIHPSVLAQRIQIPEVQNAAKSDPALVHTLHAIEQRMKDAWRFDPGHRRRHTGDSENMEGEAKLLEEQAKEALEDREVMTTEGGKPVRRRTWLGKAIDTLKGRQSVLFD